jgi:hypothetical protein
MGFGLPSDEAMTTRYFLPDLLQRLILPLIQIDNVWFALIPLTSHDETKPREETEADAAGLSMKPGRRPLYCTLLYSTNGNERWKATGEGVAILWAKSSVPTVEERRCEAVGYVCAGYILPEKGTGAKKGEKVETSCGSDRSTRA